MPSIDITTLRIRKQANMPLKSNWLVFLTKLSPIRQILRHLKVYRVHKV